MALPETAATWLFSLLLVVRDDEHVCEVVYTLISNEDKRATA